MATDWTSKAPFKITLVLISAFDRRRFYHQATDIDSFCGDILKPTHFGQNAFQNHEKYVDFLAVAHREKN